MLQMFHINKLGYVWICYIVFPTYFPEKKLVGGFNPSEKYAHQIKSFPQIGVKIPKIIEPTT